MENSFGEKKNMSLEAQPKPYLRKEDTFLQILFELNEAVEIFIRKYESQHSVTIFDYELQKASQASIHYIAGIVRLNFTFQKNDDHFSSSVILKVPQLGTFSYFADNLSLYAKEKYVYETVFPLMYDGWSKKKVVPAFYGATDLGVLVMDNLREFDYYQKHYGALLDVSTCTLVLETLAEFHALSIKHLGDIKKDLNSLTVSKKCDNEWECLIYPSIVQKLRKYVLPRSTDYFRERFEVYLLKNEKCCLLKSSAKENKFNVLLHGDLHYYNVFLKDGPGETVTECKLIDFQWARIGSPIIDIMVYLVTSMCPKQFEKHRTALFNAYLNALHRTLHEVDADYTYAYGLEDLMGDFEKYKLLLMYPITSVVPLFWANIQDLTLIDEINNLDDIFKSSEYLAFFNGWAKFLLPAESGKTMLSLQFEEGTDSESSVEE